MTDNRYRDSKDRLAHRYRELLDNDAFIDNIGSFQSEPNRDLGSEFLSTIDKLAELYSSKRGCRLDGEMILIDLESLECKNTKTYFKLESDIKMMNQGKEDVNQIMKGKQFKTEDRPTRLKNLQKDKSKMKDYRFVLATYQKISLLPRIALFEELEKCKSKVEEQLELKKKLDQKVGEFWKKWPKSIFLDCSIKINATEKASNTFKEILNYYGKTCFCCDDIESQLGLIENLLKATVLRVGKKKAGYTIFERIYDILQNYPMLEDSALLHDMKKKRDLCEQLKEIESKLKMNETVSFFEIKEVLSTFRSHCEEIDMKPSEDYVASVVRKIDPILAKLKPQITQEELKKIDRNLDDLPFKLKEKKIIEERMRKIEQFTQKFQDVTVISNPDKLMSDYKNLDAKIPSFEAVITKIENDKNLIGSVLREIKNEKLDWFRGMKLLQRLKNTTMLDPKQSQTLVVNNSLHYLRNRFLHYLKRRSLCNHGESDEIILETCHCIPKAKRIDFLRKEKIRGEEISATTKIVDVILEEEYDISWTPENWMRDKEFELIDLRDNQRFLKNLCRDLDLAAESIHVKNDLPHGAYLEDFHPGYPTQNIHEESSTDYLKGIVQEIQKNLEKNSVLELGKFASFLETERMYTWILEKHNCPRKLEQYMQRLSHFLWKIRVYKHDLLSNLIKLYHFKTKLIIRLATRSDVTLKKLEQKLKSKNYMNKLYSRGGKYYCKPDKLVTKDSKYSARAERDIHRKKNSVHDFYDDWRGLKAHFKVELEPGLEKSREFDVIFNKIKGKELEKPPMNIVFSKQISFGEFYHKVEIGSHNKNKEMEIGIFSSPRLRSMRKFMIRRDFIFQAPLGLFNLFIFCKEQWPMKLGLTFYEQQLKSESDMYCLIIFTAERQSSAKKSYSMQKRKESSSLFDLDEEDLENEQEEPPQRPRKKLFTKKTKGKEDTSGSDQDKNTTILEKPSPSVNPPNTLNKIVKEDKQDKQVKPESPQHKIYNIQFDEVKDDFDEFLTDYEHTPFSKEEQEFYELTRTFDQLNPDFVYEVGEFEDNQDNINGDIFAGNMDPSMAEEMLPNVETADHDAYYSNQNRGGASHFNNFESDLQFRSNNYDKVNHRFNNDIYAEEIDDAMLNEMATYNFGNSSAYNSKDYSKGRNRFYGNGGYGGE